MKNTKALFYDIINSIKIEETPEEIKGIAYILFESIIGVSRTDMVAEKIISVSHDMAARLQDAVQRINNHEPVQYVVGEQFFYGRKFKVSPAVLIPRPETEELIRVVVDHTHVSTNKTSSDRSRLLDIGTGSGCIAITLFHELNDFEVYATDVSDDSLTIAGENAARLAAKVRFVKHNILAESLAFPVMDIIVSNPPYVTREEMGSMSSNVVEHEPHLALFVPDDDPLIFYKGIVRKSRQILKANGLLAVEINENFGGEVSELFSREGFHSVSVLKDLSKKDRIVKGINPAS